jgi:hypothetical protein
MKFETAESIFLGTVHGRVGAVDERRSVVPVLRVDSDTDARRQMKNMIAYPTRCSQYRNDLVGDQGSVCGA